MPKFTEGVMSDGAVVLRDGVPISVGEVVLLLNAATRSSELATRAIRLFATVVEELENSAAEN